ncbi:MAG: hypothetical protein U0V04_04080 [Spirosomataceae bacterium]|jgi:hypothetical protein
MKLKPYLSRIKKAHVILGTLVILACGPSPYDYAEYFSLFYPENANTPAETKPYYYSSLFLNEEPYFYSEEPQPQKETVEETANTDAWYNYLGKKIARKSVFDALYGSTRTSALAQSIKGFKPDAAEYLTFAEKTDKLIPVKENYWDEDPVVDTVAIKTEADIAFRNFKSAKEDFLKERYLFQHVKLLHRSGYHKMAIEAYNKYNATIKSKTFISDWALSRVAGSYKRTGDTARAVLLFAQVFANAPSKRYQADLSVRGISESHFENAQKLAKTDKEKANVLAMRGVQPYQDELENIKELYKIDPKNELLELIFTREINKNEMVFFADKNANLYSNTRNFYDENYNIDPKKIKEAEEEGKTYLEKMLEFSDDVASDGKVTNPDFWKISSAYFYYLKNDSEKSQKLLEEMANTKNPVTKKQAEFLKFELSDLPSTPENEAKLLATLEGFTKTENFRDNNMLVKMSNKLANYYNQTSETKSGGWFSSCSKPKKSAGDNLKAFLAANVATVGNYYALGTDPENLIDTCSAPFLEKIVAFLNRKDLSANDKKLLALSGLKSDFVNLALMRAYVKQEDFINAAKTSRKISDKYKEEQSLTEYFDTKAKDLFLEQNNKLTRLDEYLDYLAHLKAKANTSTATAVDIYEYGNHLYNLSYFGQAWILSHREKSSMELEYNKDLSGDYYTTENVLKYYEKALQKNPDPELGAKICYAGALCERNNYWVKFYKNRPTDYDQEEAYLAKMSAEELPKFRKFFGILKSKYQNAKYEDMILKECITYANYLK